jgi:hypothetical protein
VPTTNDSTSPNTPGADAVIAANRFRFRSCYQKALADDPNAGGTVNVECWEKHRDGKIVPRCSGAAPESLNKCVCGVIASAFAGEDLQGVYRDKPCKK